MTVRPIAGDALEVDPELCVPASGCYLGGVAGTVAHVVVDTAGRLRVPGVPITGAVDVTFLDRVS